MKYRKNRDIRSVLRVVVWIVGFVLSASGLSAQEQKKFDQPRNLKVVSEEPDGKGNIVRTVQYEQGYLRVTEQIIMPQKRVLSLNPYRINPDTLKKDSLLIVVDKKRYCLQLFYRHRLIRAYKAVFGPQPLSNKCMEGDRCTPEGMFTIRNKNPNSRYNKFMLLSYPNDSAIARFNQLKQKGLIPASARIGGDIGIHGIWKGGDDMIEMGVGWTDGCVALKNKDIEDLYSMVGVGTKVLIKK
jgi:murein L,D-transpeptidase YafK